MKMAASVGFGGAGWGLLLADQKTAVPFCTPSPGDLGSYLLFSGLQAITVSTVALTGVFPLAIIIIMLKL